MDPETMQRRESRIEWLAVQAGKMAVALRTGPTVHIQRCCSVPRPDVKRWDVDGEVCRTELVCASCLTVLATVAWADGPAGVAALAAAEEVEQDA